ncbi:helix-turn-helix domain-containing protein [Xylanibacter rarus]|uniref:helix-turn-helix domain-containing protein n=1 Tax=Xylanibacter rarus TaxID=1676614 RepID=UPI003AB9A6B5
MKNIISIINSSYNPASQISRCLGSQLSTAEPAHDNAGALRTVLNSCFMALRTLLLVLLMLLPSCAGARVLAKDYMTLVKKTSDASIDYIMKKAEHYLNAGHSDTALVYYMVACNRMNDKLSDKDKQQCAMAYLKKGNIYFYMKGGFPNALKAYFNGLRIIKLCKNQYVIGRFYNNIANIYCAFNDFEKAYAYYKTGYKYCHKFGDKLYEYKILTNLTMLNVQLGKTKEARKCLSLSEKLKDEDNKANNFMGRFNYGLILIAEKDFVQAVNNFKNLESYCLDVGMEPRYLCTVYKKLYKSYIELGERDSTLKYLNLCENIFVKHGIHYFHLDVLLDRADYFDSQGDYKSASKYRARYQKARDSVYNIHDFERVKDEQTLYEMDKYDKYIASLNEREKERVLTISAQRYTIAAVSVVTLVVGLLLLVVYRQKKRIDKSYNNLFVVNRNFVNNQEIMRQRLNDAVSRLKESEAEAEQLRGRLAAYDADDVVKDAGVSEQSDNMVHKAKSGGINDDMRRKLLDSVVDIMENTTEFCSADFSLARMAALVGSNSKYVSLVINETFHKSFKNYVNEYRIHLACLRMSDTEGYGSYTLNAIAESVGFKSYTTFVELFRKIVGITPSMYKDKLKTCI